MKCQICQKPGAQNYYGVAVLNHGTYVTNARWGSDLYAASERARQAAWDFASVGDFVYNIDTVIAHTRREVVDAYHADEETR